LESVLKGKVLQGCASKFCAKIGDKLRAETAVIQNQVRYSSNSLETAILDLS